MLHTSVKSIPRSTPDSRPLRIAGRDERNRSMNRAIESALEEIERLPLQADPRRYPQWTRNIGEP